MPSSSLTKYLRIFFTFTAFLTWNCVAIAETFVGSNVDNRVLVGVSAPADGVQGFLPEGWTSVPFPAGPLEGANVLFVFIDSLVQRDTEGKNLSPANRRAVALASLGKQTDGDSVRLFVLRIYTTTPEADAYKVNVAAEIGRKTSIDGPANVGRQRVDEWNIGVSGGGSLSFNLAYTTGNRNWAPGQAFPFSAADTEFSRIYRYQQLTDLVVSTPLGKAASGEFSLTTSVPELSRVLDGSEEIVAVIDVPVYVREVYLP